MPRETYDFVVVNADEVVSAYRRIGDERRRASAPLPAGQRSSRGGAEDTALGAAARRAERAAEQRAKADERAAARKTKADEKASKDAVRLAQKEAKEIERAREHVFQIKQRYLAQEERAENKRRQAQFMQNQRNRAAVLGGVAGAIASAGIGVAKDAYSKMLDLSEQGVKQQLELGKVARRIAINARAPGAAQIDPEQLKREFTDVSGQVKGALSPADIGGATQAFITKTGDIGKAREFLPDIAQISVAADASVEAVAKTAADLFQKFGVSTRGEMQQALGSLYFGGKAGAFELSDFAEKMAPIASAGQVFGVDKGVRGVQVMSGLSQIAMEATGERDVAATAVNSALSKLISSTELVRKLTAVDGQKGVDVFDKKSNKTRRLEELLPEIITQTGGLNAEKKAAGLQEIFDERGIKAISPLISEFMKGAEASKLAGGSKSEQVAAGKAAVEAKLNAAIDATGAWSEVLRDSASAQQDDSTSLSAAWNELKAELGDQLIPVVREAVPHLVDLAAAAVPLIEVLASLAEGGSALVKQLQEWGLLSERSAKATRKVAPEKQIEQIQRDLKLRGLSEFSASTEEKSVLASARKEIAQKQQITALDTAIFGKETARSPEIIERSAELARMVKSGDLSSLPKGAQDVANGNASGMSDLDKASAAAAIQLRMFANTMQGLQSSMRPPGSVFTPETVRGG